MLDTKLDTLELIKKYQNGDTSLLETIINNNQNLAYSLVNRYKIPRTYKHPNGAIIWVKL